MVYNSFIGCDGESSFSADNQRGSGSVRAVRAENMKDTSELFGEKAGTSAALKRCEAAVLR